MTGLNHVMRRGAIYVWRRRMPVTEGQPGRFVQVSLRARPGLAAPERHPEMADQCLHPGRPPAATPRQRRREAFGKDARDAGACRTAEPAHRQYDPHRAAHGRTRLPRGCPTSKLMARGKWSEVCRCMRPTHPDS